MSTLPTVTGEPSTCLSCSVMFAAKRAIESARAEAGNFDHFQLGKKHNS